VSLTATSLDKLYILLKHSLSFRKWMFIYIIFKECKKSHCLSVSRGSRPQLIHGSLGTHESAPNHILIISAVFAGHMNVTNRQTDIQTDHATLFVAIGHVVTAIAANVA